MCKRTVVGEEARGIVGRMFEVAPDTFTERWMSVGRERVFLQRRDTRLGRGELRGLNGSDGHTGRVP